EKDKFCSFFFKVFKVPKTKGIVLDKF
ncbi:hypothetical protein CGSSp3BS71_07906, partial [Streptococcus pneumoniae SP3-BS71]